MQFVRTGGVTLHYQMIGDPAAKPLIVFVNALGTDFRIWRDVIVRLVGDYAILTYDKRGHGLSDVGPTPYTIETHAEDLAGLLDHVGAKGAIVCGVSVGGMIAQVLSSRRPDLLRALVLCDTAHKSGTPEMWQARIAAVEAEGIASIADTILERWFTREFRETVECAGYRNMLIRQPAAGYAATCAALRDADLAEVARTIAVPAICIVGEDDGSTSPALVAEFAKMVPNARFELIKRCGHLPSIEQPQMLTEIIRTFLALVLEGEASAVRH
jgi:3-oxoadipate enol-lactonase